MVASPTSGVRHRALRDLPGQLEAGDLVVVNTWPRCRRRFTRLGQEASR